MRLERKLRLVLCLIRARVRVREAMRVGFEGTHRGLGVQLVRVRVRVRVKIEVKVILGSAYFVSKSFYLVDLFFQGHFW